MKSVAFRVTGRVQGVGFRAFVHHNAVANGLAGWVRNTEDGAVEGHAEGENGAIDAFVAALHEGPRAARVARVDVHGDAAEQPGGGFEVRR